MRRALTPLVTLLLTAVLAGAVAAAPPPVKNFLAIQNSAEERLAGFTFVESNARGVAIFRLSEDGSSLSYQLIVANIENVFQAHIHLAPRGVQGPVVVWLYPSTTPGAGPAGGGRIQGVIATGTITSTNFVSDLAGQPMSALVSAMLAGNTYVNVHTNDGVAPANTGPGDFPAGEIRGQIRGLGPR
ncbi:MAG: CHRD domain-containing protein [Candidatus Limnocylindria bacterium]